MTTSRRPRFGRAELLLVLVSSLASLYALQALLLCVDRWRASRPPVTALARARWLGLRHDDRGVLDVLRDMRIRGQPAALNFGAYYALPDGLRVSGKTIFPLGGLARKLVIIGNESGQEFSIYPSDEHGFNNPLGLYNPGKVDVALIGDSFAEGSGVRPDETIAARIRLRHPRTLTFGKGALGALLELAILKEYAAPLRPKHVFWLYYGNDVQDLARESQSDFARRYLSDGFSQGLFHRRAEIEAAWRGFLAERLQALGETSTPSDQPSTAQRLRRFATLSYLYTHLARVYPLSEPDERDLALFFQVLDTARRSVQAWGGRFYFVYLPERQFFADRRFADRFRDPILRGMERRGVPVIDILDLFSRQPDPESLFWLRISTHYNPDGYRLVAQAILDELGRSRPTPAVRR